MAGITRAQQRQVNDLQGQQGQLAALNALLAQRKRLEAAFVHAHRKRDEAIREIEEIQATVIPIERDIVALADSLGLPAPPAPLGETVKS